MPSGAAKSSKVYQHRGMERLLLKRLSGIPSDSEVVETTWEKANKNGTPDKRFKDNFQIPVCLYGSIEIKSTSGINEAYSFSNHDKAQQFAFAFKEYQKSIGK
jgi:hypothetical protein